MICKLADKGDNVVIWPKKMYEAEAYHELRDHTCYQKGSFNPLSSYMNLLNDILDQYRMDGTITQEIQEALRVQDPIIAALYLLPKIHKNPNNPPGRPISN